MYRPKIRKRKKQLCALSFFPGSGSGTIISDPDPGKSSVSMRIRIHNTDLRDSPTRFSSSSIFHKANIPRPVTKGLTYFYFENSLSYSNFKFKKSDSPGLIKTFFYPGVFSFIVKIRLIFWHCYLKGLCKCTVRRFKDDEEEKHFNDNKGKELSQTKLICEIFSAISVYILDICILCQNEGNWRIVFGDYKTYFVGWKVGNILKGRIRILSKRVRIPTLLPRQVHANRIVSSYWRMGSIFFFK